MDKFEKQRRLFQEAELRGLYVEKDEIRYRLVSLTNAIYKRRGEISEITREIKDLEKVYNEILKKIRLKSLDTVYDV